MDDDINITGWTGAEEKQVTEARTDARHIQEEETPKRPD